MVGAKKGVGINKTSLPAKSETLPAGSEVTPATPLATDVRQRTKPYFEKIDLVNSDGKMYSRISNYGHLKNLAGKENKFIAGDGYDAKIYGNLSVNEEGKVSVVIGESHIPIEHDVRLKYEPNERNQAKIVEVLQKPTIGLSKADADIVVQSIISEKDGYKRVAYDAIQPENIGNTKLSKSAAEKVVAHLPEIRASVRTELGYTDHPTFKAFGNEFRIVPSPLKRQATNRNVTIMDDSHIVDGFVFTKRIRTVNGSEVTYPEHSVANESEASESTDRFQIQSRRVFRDRDDSSKIRYEWFPVGNIRPEMKDRDNLSSFAEQEVFGPEEPPKEMF